MRILVSVFKSGRWFLLVAAVALVMLLSARPALANCDYMFFSVNGDTSLSTMTQGDMVGWGSNCTVGQTLYWQIWVDVNINGIIDPEVDRMIIEFEVTDGQTDGHAPPDINPVPDGWYITNEMPLSMAPTQYIFMVWENYSHTGTGRVLVCNAMQNPPNAIQGSLFVEGHPAPDADMLAYRWIECSPLDADFEMWAALTDENGNYSVNIGESGTGVEFRVSPPNIDGYAGPGETSVMVSGIVEGIDFEYSLPADSLYGYLLNQYENPILRNASGYCNRMNGNGNKDFNINNGYYVVYFGPAEYGIWNININTDNLIPDYLVPMGSQIEIGTIHGQQLNFTCIDADTVIYARVTENGQNPSHSYRVSAQSNLLQSMTQAISDTGSLNLAILSISSVDGNGWNINVSQYDNSYPIPPGYVLENEGLSNRSPGDTVILNFIAGTMVRDTIFVDPGDPPVNWQYVWVSAGQNGNYFGTNPDGNGIYTLFADTGMYFISANYDGYLTIPPFHQIHLLSDTTGGFSFILNNRHCRVWGTLQNIPLPTYGSIGVQAHSGNPNEGYSAWGQVDSATGNYSFYLCDADWTLDPPYIFGRTSPMPAQFTVGEIPDTVMHIDLVYIDPSSVDEENLVPNTYTLKQNYPNPFNSRTAIAFGIPEANEVSIEIYDILGRKIESQFLGNLSAGYHNFQWDAANKPSGIYFYRIKAGEFNQMRKMLLLK